MPVAEVVEVERPSAERAGLSRGEIAVALAVGLLALGVYLWQLSVPEVMSFYDTGVYFAAAFHFVSGALPYRDFTFVQPPGLVYLLAPIALVSRVVGTHDGLIIGRVATSIATATNCSLAALLVRHYGKAAMYVVGTALALSPAAFFVSSEIKVDPWCLLFVLAAVLVCLGDGRVARLSRRAAVGVGVLIGCAALVKLWAFFPFLALAGIVAVRARRRVWPFVAAAGGTFVVGSLPFLIVAPRAYVTQVILEQVGRRANPTDSGSLLWRVRALTGYLDTLVAPSARVALAAFALLGLGVVVVYRRASRVPDADWLVLACAIAIVVMLLISPETYIYYFYFAQPFLLALAAIVLWRGARRVRPLINRIAVSPPTRRAVVALAAAGLAVASVAMVLYTTSFFSAYDYVFGAYQPWINPVEKVIPPGACVLYNEIYLGAYANRLATNDPTCPDVVDVTGEWMAYGYHDTGAPRAFSRLWRGYFSRSTYVVVNGPKYANIPWDVTLEAWFTRHFRLVYRGTLLEIYEVRPGAGG